MSTAAAIAATEHTTTPKQPPELAEALRLFLRYPEGQNRSAASIGAYRAELPELPAVLAFLPELQFNGPGMHLTLLGTIDAITHRPEIAGYDVHIPDVQPIIDDASGRIQHVASKYRLGKMAAARLTEQFRFAAAHRIAGS